MKKMLLLAAILTVLRAAPARAGSNDCLFDGTCGARPSLSIVSPEPVSEAAPSFSHLSGLKKGATEGATLGFMGTLTPAVFLIDEGFSRQMGRHYDGSRAANSDAYYYGGIALGVLLYIPALVLGAIGGLFGAAAGASAPETAKGWDAESYLLGDRR